MPEPSQESLYNGQLVKLGALRPDEMDHQARWSNDADYWRNLHFRPALPRPASFYEERHKKDADHDDGRSVEFAIRTLADDKLIGLTGLWITWNNQTAMFWIGIGDADYRGKGYGTDATRLVIGYAFRELNLFRVQLGVFGYNVRAQRAYEKAGFIHEGVARESLYRDGVYWDIHQMAILRPEWEAIQELQTQSELERALP